MYKRLKRFLATSLDRIPEGFYSLKFRLMGIITVLLLIVVGVPLTLFVNRLDKNYGEFSTTMLDVTTMFAYQQIYDGLMENDSMQIQQNLDLLARDPRIHLMRIHQPEGRILYSTNSAEINRNIDNLDEDEDTRRIHRADTYARTGNTYSYQYPIYVESACTKCHEQEGATLGYMDVSANFMGSTQLYSYAKSLSVTGGILIIVVLWLAINLLYEGQVARKLRRFIKGFDELAQGNFQATVTMSGRHELAELAGRFNETVKTLEAARRHEEQLYQEKLERADRLVTLGEIAAEIAHEVNNPTGIIRSRAELVLDELEDHDPQAEYLEDVDMIVRQTERIADITRSILHYARKQPRTYNQTDLNEVVRHSVNMLQPRMKKRNASIELSLPEEDTLVWGSFSQLEQVFCNLINNSLDAIDGREGHLGIDISPYINGTGIPYYRVRYHDNGPGIPPEIQKQVFSPFFTTKSEGKGTGLGLFIARNIIDGHRGTLTLNTDTPEGACFIIQMEKHDG